ncbi:MAG: carbonic anhydrase [Acidobacteria bacterium]|nr:carbonic anhydrase [Acidobacteriota bacterium]
MDKLLKGYSKFRKEVFPREKHNFKMLASSQAPHALFITCADSRVDPSMILQAPPGELFICKVVGNLVPAYGSAMGGVASAVEYAVTVLGVSDVIICGHSDCGAMRAFLHPEKLRSLKAVEAWLEHATTAIAVSKDHHSHLEGDAYVEALTKENIVSQLQHLRTHPSVASRMRRGNLAIHGWYYDIGEGTVSSYADDSGSFHLLDEEAVIKAVA